ncbi:MAG: hypothetical protein HHJ11_05415 [Phycicoccus sp.]|nr:hypothetical protein [Phycicoccus sp.]
MSHSRVQTRPKRRVARFSGRRIFGISVALGLALAGGIPTATATQPDPTHKDYVCKYVGTPGVSERLQTGNNPIWVDTAATEPGLVTGLFNDAHRSFVIVADTLKLDPEPGIDQCPNGDGPKQPDPLVSDTQVTDTTCDVFTTTTTTTTTKYVWSDAEEDWVLGTPEVTTSVDTRKPTGDEIKDAGLDCKPEQPHRPDLRTSSVTFDTTCTAFTTTTTSITTKYVWSDAEEDWVLGTPEVTTSVDTRKPTGDEIKDAGLDCKPEQPHRPDLRTSSVTFDTTCDAFTTTTTSITTKYVWSDAEEDWVLGTPEVTTSVDTRKPTPEQIAEIPGLHCTVDTPPVDVPPVDVPPVTVVVPAVRVLGVVADAPPKASPRVLGVVADANPLPAGASAGEADTSGQAVAGELTGLAALLTLGAAFVLRLRRGVV